jgi:hypothetical protein
MKKTTFISLIVLLCSSSLLAQKSNIVKTDLFSPIIRTYVLKYERVLNDDMSGQLGFFYTGYSPSGTDVRLTGWGITPEFRYYLSEQAAPHGFYIAPNVRYYNFTAEDESTNESGSLSNVSLAFNIGGQLFLKDVVVFDFWLGPSYNFRTAKVDDPTSDIDYGVSAENGFGIRAGFSIGIAF